MAVAFQRPVIYYRPPMSTLLPPPPDPGIPPTVSNPTLVGTHTGGACGCGTAHDESPASDTAPAGTGPPLKGPSFSTVALALDTPAGFQAPATTEGSMDFLKDIDWVRDWWKFLAGALAMRVLSK